MKVCYDEFLIHKISNVPYHNLICLLFWLSHWVHLSIYRENHQTPPGNYDILVKGKFIKFYNFNTRGRGTGEASEATASPEFRGFTTEKFLAS